MWLVVVHQTVDAVFLENCSLLYRYDLDLHYTGLYGVYAYNAYTKTLMYIGTPYVWLNSCSIDGFALVLLVICYDSALMSNMYPFTEDT